MAATRRNRSKPDDASQKRTREIISTTQLVKRLQAFALGDPKVDIDTNRLRAIDILLKKVLPDLSTVENIGEVTVSYIARMPAPSGDAAEWLKAYRSSPGSHDPSHKPH